MFVCVTLDQFIFLPSGLRHDVFGLSVCACVRAEVCAGPD